MNRLPRNIIAFLAFTVAVLLLLFLSPRSQQRLQAWFLGIVSPMLSKGSSLEQRWSAYRVGVASLEQLEADNRKFKTENAELKATNQTLRGFEAENARLRNALGYRERAPFTLIPARIIARDDSSWYSTIVIDRGTADGIGPDMAVLTEEGLVGKTQTADEHTAKVILITDENCGVSATVEGSKERGVVYGQRAQSIKKPTLRMTLLSKNAGLIQGAKVVTAGLGGVFPAGITVGEIHEFKPQELEGVALLKPIVDVTAIEEVFVKVGDKK